MVGERKDITLCSLGIQHAGDKLSLAWRLGLRLLGVFRKFTFLPGLVSTVPILVIYRGGDALSVCLNTVAVLFMCEIDNVAYSVGLSERVKTRIEQFGRVELGADEVARLVWSKATHVGLIVLAVLASVSSRSYGLTFAFSYFAFWIGAVVEAVGPGCLKEGTAATVAQTTGSCLLGIVMFALMMFFATMLGPKGLGPMGGPKTEA